MQLAIAKAREGIAAGQSPFGCAIARQSTLLSCAHNSVVADCDITAHAEVNALRRACQASGEIWLVGAMAATTCEPCPMCMSALHWARIEVVYFGATIADAAAAGFNELRLSAQDCLRLGQSPVKLVSGVLAQQCRELFADWLASPHRRAY
jgi:tRNA(Arg) A34 adenosine deaminase TadA